MSKKVTRTYDYTGESFTIENGNEPPKDTPRWYDVEKGTDADGNEYQVIDNSGDKTRDR